VKIFFASVADEIRHAVRRADEQQRTIEKIELNDREWNELKSALAAYQIYPGRTQFVGEHIRYMGVSVVREQSL
jgi:hypothetical protein